MSGNLLNPRPLGKLITSVSAAAATATSAVFALPIADAYSIVIIAVAGTGTTPTCDIQLKTSVDGGTTYAACPLRAAQITTSAVTNWWTFRNGLGIGEAGIDNIAPATGGTLAKPFIFDPRYMKITYTIGGTNPSFSFDVYGFALAKSVNAY